MSDKEQQILTDLGLVVSQLSSRIIANIDWEKACREAMGEAECLEVVKQLQELLPPSDTNLVNRSADIAVNVVAATMKRLHAHAAPVIEQRLKEHWFKQGTSHAD